MENAPVTMTNRSSAIQLIAIDLDGTLLNSRLEVSPANRQALVAAAERGIQLLVVTGRRFHSALPFVRQIPCPITVISSNGARIADSTGEVHHRDFLPLRVARQVLEATPGYRPYAVAIFDTPDRGQVMMQDNAVVEGPLGWYLRNSPDSLAQVVDLEVAITNDPIQVMFGGPPERVEPIEAVLRSSIPANTVHLTWTRYLTRNTSILDVMNSGCSKGAALRLWVARCAIEPASVMAIGDNYNDLEMLRFAGWPILMANRAAGLDGDGWPVTLSNDEDGVAAAIHRYVCG